MKTAFMNSMSHEIRTPLNSIQGFSGVLLDENVDDEMKPEMKSAIEKSVLQLTCLLDDMLEISLLGCTDEVPSIAPVNIEELCTECLNYEEQMHGKDSIKYRIDYSCDAKVFDSNRDYLEKILRNLLANANKFTEEGCITLSCSQNTAGKQLILSVSDTGIGIPEEKREWVFEAFTKADDFKPGTGSGLYVCKEIVRHLQGKIYIDPTHSPGTKIKIELPDRYQ